MIIILTKLMFAPIHIQPNFHMSLSSKPYLPTTKLKSFLLNCKGCSIHNTSKVGRDWRVFSHGIVDKKFEAIIASNIQLFATDQGTSEEDEVDKWIYGWSENGSDEGSLLVEILQIDGRRPITDYESRAHTFGRSVELFGARKTKNENCRK